MEAKICSNCKIELPLSNFSYKNKKEGKLQSHCKKCQKVWKDKHYQDNKKKYIENVKIQKKKNKLWWFEYKNTLVCEECGENHIATLDFHHNDSNEKEFSMSRIRDRGKKKIIEEMKKCKVLCANCHRKLHWKLRNHGALA